MKRNHGNDDKSSVMSDKGGRDFRDSRDSGGSDKKGFQRRKGCRFCGDSPMLIDYKDKNLLSMFITERFKIVPRRISGTCSTHQRHLTIAIKRARHLAFIAYTTAHI